MQRNNKIWPYCQSAHFKEHSGSVFDCLKCRNYIHCYILALCFTEKFMPVLFFIEIIIFSVDVDYLLINLFIY